jgi:tagaturonate reductase
MNALPETVLQFGSGRFLRAFADLFIHQANEEGQAVGKVVVVQSTGEDTAGGLTRQGGRYHVLVRGLEAGQVVDRVEASSSVSRALFAGSQWDEVTACARSPQLRVVLSNTTEAGYELDPADGPDAQPPRSFPAKLLAVLRERHEAGLPGVTVVPCELREHNAELLQGIVLDLAGRWRLPEDFRGWLQTSCVWLETLVDRIVTGPPADHPLLARDALLCTAEPYALWAIQDRPGADRFLSHKAVTWAPDVTPYFLRKVRILNAAHTALLIKAWPLGFKTVREAVLDPGLGGWLERLLFEEVVPVLRGRVEDPEGFARQTLERFRNPFQEHKLSDIARHHAQKVEVRLVPTHAEHRAKLGKVPHLLGEVLAMPAPDCATG